MGCTSDAFPAIARHPPRSWRSTAQRVGYLVPAVDFEGKVHSLFARACNISCGATLLTVVADELADGPTTIKLAPGTAPDLRRLFRTGERLTLPERHCVNAQRRALPCARRDLAPCQGSARRIPSAIGSRPAAVGSSRAVSGRCVEAPPSHAFERPRSRGGPGTARSGGRNPKARRRKGDGASRSADRMGRGPHARGR